MGCATAGTRGTVGPAPEAPPTPAPEVPDQWLFRAELAGEEGSGSLKLLLRRYGGDRFTLSAADALGQARWEIRGDRDEAVWLDPQGERFCRLDARLPLRATPWVTKVRLADFPGLLTGEWPPAAAVVDSSGAPKPGLPAASAELSGPAEAFEPVGEAASGGRWITGERSASGWSSWTLWEDGLPAVWFKRLGSESLLSVRRPSVQVRWRVTARSGLPLPPDPAGAAFALLPGELLTSSREIACPDNAIP